MQKERRRRRAQKRLSKRVFLESPFLLCPPKVFRTFQLFSRTNLKGAEKKRTLQKHPFGQPFLRTTPSPLLWRALSFNSKCAIFGRSEKGWIPQAFGVSAPKLFFVNSVHTRCIVKTSGFTTGVCKNRGFFIKFKGFSCGIPREQAILRKSKTPRNSTETWTFLSLAFYNAPSLHTVDFCRNGSCHSSCDALVRSCAFFPRVSSAIVRLQWFV